LVKIVGPKCLSNVIVHNYTSEEERAEEVQALIDTGVNVNKITQSPYPPLFLAFIYAGEPTLKALSSARGFDVNVKDDIGNTVLIYYADLGCKAEIKRILEFPGVNVYATDRFGKTAIEYAEKYPEIAELIQNYIARESNTSRTTAGTSMTTD